MRFPPTPTYTYTLQDIYYCLLISSPKSENPCPPPQRFLSLGSFPHNVMSFTNDPASINGIYAIRSTVGHTPCIHEQPTHMGELHLAIQILSETLMFKNFTGALYNCTAFVRPDMVSYIETNSPRWWSFEARRLTIFLFLQWKVTPVGIPKPDSGTFMIQQSNTKDFMMLSRNGQLNVVTNTTALTTEQITPLTWTIAISYPDLGLR